MVYNQMTSAAVTEATGTSATAAKRRLEEEHDEQPSPAASSSGSRTKNLTNQQNHILLLTVVKPIYPITVDVLHKICSPFGNVLRIVIFRKNGVQAMVEFENIETATLAKDGLDGADIYSDCCTLKIEYAKPERLSVYKNYSLTWDFTKTPKESSGNMDSKQPLLQYPPSLPSVSGRSSIPIASSLSDYGSSVSLNHKTNKYPLSNRNDCENGLVSGVYHPKRKMMRTAELSPPPMPPPPPPPHHYYHRQLQPQLQPHHYYDQDENDDYDDSNCHRRRQPLLHGHVLEHYSRAVGGYDDAYSASSFVPIKAPGSVLMVYGLDPLNANAEKLFNILCLYGNVLKVKFLKTKEGTAMVEMGDAFQADKCVSHLTNIVCSSFGGSGNGGRSGSEHFQEFKFQLQISKQNFLSDVLSPFRLADNSLSFRDFSNSKNNRFLTLQASNKNRYTSPCKIVHFFNTPPHVTDNELINVFRRYNVPTPIRIHRLAAKSDKSSTGFLEFVSIGDAVAAIVCCNHAAVESSESKFPFIMKLCFSSYKNEIPSNGGTGGGGGK